MLAIKHILFPIDFSERCCGTAPFVRALADRLSAKITLLTAVAPIWQAGLGEGAIPVDMTELRQDLEVQLNNTFVPEFQGLAVERIAEIGDPAEIITRFAHTKGVDLIMMPTHGYGPFRSPAAGFGHSQGAARCRMSSLDGASHGAAAERTHNWQ